MIQDSGSFHRFACGLAVMKQVFRRGMGGLDHVEPRLGAALGDVLARPGSLMRAAIAYFIGVEMGLAEELARAIGCGIEYLHTASLIFDDLPAMDDARTRRGAPCLHVAHGESVAMRAALALINRGYGLIWQGIGGASELRRKREQLTEVIDRLLIGRGEKDSGDGDSREPPREEPPPRS